MNVDDLLGKFVVIFVGRRPGMEREDLLSDGSSQEEEAEEEGGLWSRWEWSTNHQCCRE